MVISSNNTIVEEKEEYYTTKWRKINDFLTGFIGVPVAVLLITMLFVYLFGKILANSGIAIPISILQIIITTILIIYALKRRYPQRRYIFIGMSAMIFLPFIVFGACVLVLITVGGI